MAAERWLARRARRWLWKVAAPVAVPDDVAGELLSAVHTGLSEGATPAVALARAGLDTGLSAPFQCHGDGF